MVKRASDRIVVVLALIALAMFIGINTGAFNIFTGNQEYPITIAVFGSPSTQLDEQFTSIRCSDISSNIVIFNELYAEGLDPTFCKTGTFGYFDYGYKSSYGCFGSSCYFSTLQFDILRNESLRSCNSQGTCSPIQNTDNNIKLIYHQTGSNNKFYYSINTPITCTDTACDGIQITPDNTIGPISIKKIDLSSYKGQAISNIYLATLSSQSDGSFGGAITSLQTNFIVPTTSPIDSADLNGDGKINFSELNQYGVAWSQGLISNADLLLVAQAWVNS